MTLVWDYDIETLKKSKRGRLLLLERQINYGVDGDEKIDLEEVKKNWDVLQIDPSRRRRQFLHNGYPRRESLDLQV